MSTVSLMLVPGQVNCMQMDTDSDLTAQAEVYLDVPSDYLVPTSGGQNVNYVSLRDRGNIRVTWFYFPTRQRRGQQ